MKLELYPIRAWSKLAVMLGATAWVLSAPTNAMASDHGHGGHAAAAEEEEDLSSEFKTLGLELGSYEIRAYYPVQAQYSFVRFTLHGSVASEYYTAAKQYVEDHKHTLRDQVIIATRMAPLTVYDEPGLESFRRRIFLRLRRAMPDLPIDGVYVSAFQLQVKSL